MADSINGIIQSKLAAHYGTNIDIDTLLLRFAGDNPTYGPRPLGTRAFYSATASESLNDAAYRWWSAYVP